jgi:hypothetical protein
VSTLSALKVSIPINRHRKKSGNNVFDGTLFYSRKAELMEKLVIGTGILFWIIIRIRLRLTQ